MPQRQYDIINGQDRTTLTNASGSSISTSAVRVTIDDVNCPTKADAIRLLEVIMQVIRSGNYPPP